MQPKITHKKGKEQLEIKEVCCKCGGFAEWWLMSATTNQEFFCDNCVSRGCSCQTDEDGNDLRDEFGKLLPCCEYDYNIEGWDKWQFSK